MRHSRNLITEILLEMALDENIPSGIVDLTNFDHVELLALNLFDRGATQQMVAEVVNKIAIRDGQFPDRQAYNKDGWLVTFPSAEYKQNAIKKGTHFNSDPTHGQGGMNLYYKKRGKQKRQTHQDLTQVGDMKPEPTKPPTQKPHNPRVAGKPAPGADQSEPGDRANPSVDFDKEPNSGETDDTSTLPKVGDVNSPTTTTPAPSSQSSDKSSASTQPTAQASEPKLATTSPVVTVSHQVSITQDFAKTKSWVSSPYGEWRDSSGNTVAVESLSGEVTPIKSTDREELKIFADKKK